MNRMAMSTRIPPLKPQSFGNPLLINILQLTSSESIRKSYGQRSASTGSHLKCIHREAFPSIDGSLPTTLIPVPISTRVYSGSRAFTRCTLSTQCRNSILIAYHTERAKLFEIFFIRNHIVRR